MLCSARENMAWHVTVMAFPRNLCSLFSVRLLSYDVGFSVENNTDDNQANVLFGGYRGARARCKLKKSTISLGEAQFAHHVRMFERPRLPLLSMPSRLHPCSCLAGDTQYARMCARSFHLPPGAHTYHVD